ncbi:MAG: hypothetical protein ING29_06215 [Azospirillum sp.]|nr:hypothetical protein [Azospirillum sp.]
MTGRAGLAGTVYFAVVFAIGFVLGTVRVLFLAPALGEGIATLIELPAMLAASWFVCGWCVGRFGVPPAPGARATMGGAAFGMLMAVEAMLSILVFGRTPLGHIARYAEIGPALGLAAQIAFAAFPLLRR